MIHDFAKSPRTYTLAPQATAAAPVLPRRRIRGRWLLLALMAGSVLIWRLTSEPRVAEAEFVPGKPEATEYEAALAQEVRERQATKAAPAKAVEAEPDTSALEQQRIIAEFQKKLKSMPSAEPEFGFYDSLAGSSWSVPVQRGIYVTEEDRKRASQRYMLQAASVRDLAEAQRIVQKLRQLGLQAFYSDGGTGWYRVNVGPFDNVSKMNKAEDILVSLRMMPLKRRL